MSDGSNLPNGIWILLTVTVCYNVIIIPVQNENKNGGAEIAGYSTLLCINFMLSL